MPFLDLPEHGAEVYYLVNPRSELFFAKRDQETPEPECAPYDPSKPTLFLLASFGQCVATLSRQFADLRLQATFNLIGMDPICHGQTRMKPRRSVSIEDVADVCIAVLDKLEIAQFAMFGEGVLGACCAAWFAIKLARERVQAIILASAGWMVEDARIVELIGGCLEETRIQKGDDVDAPLPPEVTQGIASYYFGWPPRRPERAKEYMDHLQVTYGSGHDMQDFTHLLDFRLRERIPQALLEKVTQPVLLLYGSLDNTGSSPQAVAEWREAFVNASGGAEFFEISGAPHHLSFDEFNIVNRFILLFLRKHGIA